MPSRSILADLTPTFLFLLLAATLGPLLFGYHLAELNAPSEVLTCAKKSLASPTALSRLHSALVDTLSHPAKTTATTTTTTTTLPQCIPMTTPQFSLTSSLFTLGGFLSALAAGPLTARTGRIRTMLYAAFLATLGPLCEAFAPSLPIIALGRLISGLGAGAAMVVAPLYIAEIAPPGHKGLFGSFTQVMVNVGILITQVLGYFLSYGGMWRVVLGVAGGIGAVQVFGLGVGGVEGPVSMVESGRTGEARDVLRRLRGKGADVEGEFAALNAQAVGGGDGEQEALLAGAETGASPAKHDKNDTLGAFDVLRIPSTRRAVIAITGVMLAQQLTGINSIIMYGVALLSNLLAANSALLNVAVSGINVLITAAAAPLVDKLGRKTCLLMSISGMGTSSVLLAFGIMRSIPILSAVAVLTFVASFGLGLGPVPFILASELVDANAVGAVQSWALAVNWTATFTVAQFFPMLNEAMGKGQVYFIFAATALILGAFVFWYVPESKGKKSADEVWGRVKGGGRED